MTQKVKWYKTKKFKVLVGTIVAAVATYFGVEISGSNVDTFNSILSIFS